MPEVSDPPLRTEVIDDWTGTVDRIRDPEQTRLAWYAEVGPDQTTIWANFQGANPNEELVEINVRRSVFYPVEHHLNYITVRGFELAQAASPWAPPTADQPGLIGPNWAKGWIIEDNVIHDAKCSAVSIGKEISTGHNYATLRLDKPGYQYQLESVFAARQIGWDREHVGSHIVRRNTIYDCGQNGIVGHLGCVFSTIEDNHIYNIALKREFYGYEIAGIKLHAAIDVIIRHNRIHDCSLGIWLDWQTQGTRVSRNLLYHNNRDLFVEVSHGPYLVEHNILGSPASLEIFSQGGAFVNNLVCGTVLLEPVLERPTPYHLPHSTQVAGYAAVHGGDDRHIGNIFLGGDATLAYGTSARPSRGADHGTVGYNGHPASMEDYLALVGDPTRGDHQRFMGVKQPVHIRDNVYAGGAKPFEAEQGATVLTGNDVVATIVDEGTEVYLESCLPAEFDSVRLGVITGSDLERVRFVDAEFEERDGSPAILATDLVGAREDQARLLPGRTDHRARIGRGTHPRLVGSPLHEMKIFTEGRASTDSLVRCACRDCLSAPLSAFGVARNRSYSSTWMSASAGRIRRATPMAQDLPSCASPDSLTISPFTARARHRQPSTPDRDLDGSILAPSSDLDVPGVRGLRRDLRAQPPALRQRWLPHQRARAGVSTTATQAPRAITSSNATTSSKGIPRSRKLRIAAAPVLRNQPISTRRVTAYNVYMEGPAVVTGRGDRCRPASIPARVDPPTPRPLPGFFLRLGARSLTRSPNNDVRVGRKDQR